MKKFFSSRMYLFLVLVFFVPVVFGGGIGDTCDYSVYGDTQCDPDLRIFCIARVCTEWHDASEGTCDGPVGYDIYTQQGVTVTDRNPDGSFFETTMTDFCEWSGSPVDACSVDRGNCTVKEYSCTGSPETPYLISTEPCSSGCSNGACIDSIEPDSWLNVGGTYNESTWPGSISGGASDNQSGLAKVEVLVQRISDGRYWGGSQWVADETFVSSAGTANWSYSFLFSNLSAGLYSVKSRAMDFSGNVETSLPDNQLNIMASESEGQDIGCDFSENLDNECDTQNWYYCVENMCTYQLGPVPDSSCTGTDQNFFKKQSISVLYRGEDGGIMMDSLVDSCMGDNVREYYCLEPFPEYGENYDINQFKCLEGCSNGACKLISQQDGNSVDFPVVSELISDQQLLAYIAQWATGFLGQTESENDTAIHAIIELWKNS